MIRIGKSQYIFTDGTSFVQLAELYGTSNDDKPTTGYATGSSFVEVDTGKLFLYDEESGDWSEVSGTGGGGGGESDVEIVEVTFVNSTSDGAQMYCSCVINDYASSQFAVEANDSVTVQVILYKGLADCYGISYNNLNLALSGDNYNADEAITGAGTITITDVGE